MAFYGAGEIAQCLITHTSLTENLNLDPTTHITRLPVMHISTSRRSDALFRPLLAPNILCFILIHKYLHTYNLQ